MKMKVLSFCHSSGFSSSLPGFIIYFMTIYVHKLEPAQFKVVGPDHLVTAIVGEEIVLPCHLSPRMSAEKMEVTWFRSQISPFVHHYSDGKDQYGQQMPEYQGRTELLKDGLTNGSVALRIFRIRLSDEGQYHCLVLDGIFYEEALLELKVAASGSAPHIFVEDYQDGGIRVVCRSAGWYPEPEVLWRDLKGQPLPSSSQTNSREASRLYKTETSIILTENSNQNLSCLVRNTRLSLEKESLFYISDPFFPKVNPWMVALGVILVVLLGSFALSAYLFKIKDQVTVKMKILSFCHSSRASSPLPGFIVFFLLCYVHKIESAKFTVTGPHDPVTAILGQETALPCHLSPSMSAANMEVRWFRSHFESFVHLYRDGMDQYEGQMPEYHGRTELLKAGLTDGNVPLRILNIRLADEGLYLCFVQDDTIYGETVLELRVAGLGSAPLISVEGHQDGGIRVVCQSAGWYPEPEVLWKDLNGQHLPSLSETTSQGDNGLFETETALIVKEHSNQNLSCCLRNTVLNQEKESAVYIADSFFPRVNPWMVALSVILVVLFGFIGLTVYLFKMKEKLTEEVEKRDNEIRWRRSVAPIEEATVTLDPDTAYPQLVLSEDRKTVRWGDTWQDLPNNPERFDSWACVLGCEGFTSGRHCWEVEVGDGLSWAVGVARESVERKGGISLSPEGGIWAVQRLVGQFRALTSPVTPLHLNRVPSRIRVCLDCDRGQVTFIDAGDEAPIFTFPPGSVPGERIRPWLRVLGGSQLRLCP
ncbi:butyrophilin subfamily 1 member A1-like isoform X3 [Chrysemys picta bellii]|uniref:butyrophilin subfamily 1 member A1-like isoform X3 n=1 Tax=Chrysemys picta bellii TaxID=8478 RepID=UPI0032B2A07A